MGHFYPRQAVLAPAGLITEPNEYGQYPPGALKLARNVTMREPGKLVQAPDVTMLTRVGFSYDVIRKLIPADTSVVYAIVENSEGWKIFADGVEQTFVNSDGTVDNQDIEAFSSTGRIGWAQCNERVVVNGRYGQLVRDPVPLSADFRAAGLPQASITRAAFFGSGGWLLGDQSVQYRACIVRRYEDGYALRSAPSPAIRVHNGTGNPGRTPYVQIEWPKPPVAPGASVEPGDIVELYRTDILQTTSAYADAGATYKLVQEYALTDADLASPYLQLVDTQPPILGTLKTAGRELYTNPGVEGETYANLRPPIAQCLVSFKGFCFYGNTTERAKLTISVPGGWGEIAGAAGGGVDPVVAREKGIGVRQGSGDTTLDSPVITNVSAADILGVSIGQQDDLNNQFTAGTPVIAVGASTITMGENANATTVGSTWRLIDVLEIDGGTYPMHKPDVLLDVLDGLMEVQFDQSMSNDPLYYSSFKLSLMWNYHSFARPMELRASNGQNYSPPIAPLGADDVTRIEPLVRKNRVCWSKEQQPEHVPSVSETFVGFGEIYAMNATRDAIWIWCSDGLHRLSGNGGSLGLGAWQVDYANATLLLCAPQASTVLEDKLYGYTNAGVVEVDSAGNRRDLTAGVLANLIPGIRYREAMEPILERNEEDGEILLALGELDNGFSSRIYIYNVREGGWTYLDENGEFLSNVTAIAMFRLPPDLAEPQVLFASFAEGLAPAYSRWTGGNPDGGFIYLWSTAQYQPLYGNDPLELKRWMWGDFLFGADSASEITVLWNNLSQGPVPTQLLDVGLYARAGCGREGGLSHSICPGFEWDAADFQSRFEGISLAIKQRTNQSKQR